MKKLFRVFTSDFTDTWKGFKKEKIKPLTLILVIVNIVCLLISNIIAAKQVTLFTIGNLTVNLPTAMILYPIVLTISDLLANIDYIWTRRSCHLGFLLNLLMVGVFELAIVMPGATDLSVLHSTSFMLLASMISFYFGDLVNDLIFLKLKTKDGTQNKIVKRCIISTLFGQLVDSTIFLGLGMNVFPKLFLGFAYMTWAQVGVAILVQVILKLLYELVISPLVVIICKKVDSHEHTNKDSLCVEKSQNVEEVEFEEKSKEELKREYMRNYMREYRKNKKNSQNK